MFLQSYDCVICNGHVEESLSHLFLECPLAISSWNQLHLHVLASFNPFEILESFRDQLQVPFFMDIIILIAWCIWMARNDLIFRNVILSQANVKLLFRTEFDWATLRAPAVRSPLSFPMDRKSFIV
jgi:hypothetical protein